MSDALDEIGKDCPRCGSLLPDAEEGICQTCGYEYGRATLFMPIVTAPKASTPAPDSEDAIDAAQAPPGEAASSAQPGPAPEGASPVGRVREAPNGSKLLWGVLILLVLLFFGILAVIGWILLRS